MISNVAVIVFDEVSPFELGVACEAWAIDRSADGLPVMDFAVCSPDGRPVRTIAGFDIAVQHGLDRVAAADLVVLPAMSRDIPVPAEVIHALRAAHDRGARLLSICSGAFVLGVAGLLDGRRCTTHWMHTEQMDRRRAPRSWAARSAWIASAGTGMSRDMAGRTTRSAAATRSRTCWTATSKPAIVRTGRPSGLHTAKSMTGKPSPERSIAQASQATPSSKGETSSNTMTATLLIMGPCSQQRGRKSTTA